MNKEQDENRFADADKPYTSLGGGLMAKSGRWVVYTLSGVCVLIIVIVAGFFLSKTGGKRTGDSALKSVLRLENRVQTLCARVDKLQAGLETVSAQRDAIGNNAQEISALSESIRSLQLRIRHRAVIRAISPAKKKAGSHARYHVVKKGETLYRIAKNYRISLSRLMSANHLTTQSVIHPGKRLIIRR